MEVAFLEIINKVSNITTRNLVSAPIQRVIYQVANITVIDIEKSNTTRSVLFNSRIQEV